jgi:predicted dehydrogenase
MHARVYKNIGFELVCCTDIHEPTGRAFADRNNCEFVKSFEEVCRHPKVDYVDLCTFPDFRLQPVTACAEAKKHIQVQKPISTNLETARKMIDTANKAGITLGVVSQHRFDDSTVFLIKALREGRLGKILQADAYVKWFRSAEYYSRPIKGSWATEGGGALINQAVHQVDVLLYLIGPVREVFGMWQLGSRHKIESEDVVSALLRYRNGAQGVIQASTAFWPGYPERIEIHGTKGTAVLTGDKLTTWDVDGDDGAPAPLEQLTGTGASDPMAIPLTPIERQFRDFADAVQKGRPPLVSAEEGYRALELVLSVYRSCREGQKVILE